MKEEEQKKETSGNFLQNLKENLPEIKKKAFGTQGIIISSVIFAFLFLVVIVVQSCTPQKGSILYGMCGAFLEQELTYPETIKHSNVEQYRKAVRIYYTHIDAFGQYQLEMVECSFLQDAEKGVRLESVVFDRVRDSTKKTPVTGKGRLFEVKQKYIDQFNQSESPAAILLNEPDLTLPEYRGYEFVPQEE